MNIYLLILIIVLVLVFIIAVAIALYHWKYGAVRPKWGRFSDNPHKSKISESTNVFGDDDED